MPRAALLAERVSKRYGAVVALDEVSLNIPPGALLALVGESGSGKSTLLRCFNRLVDPDAGVVRVDGDDVAAIDAVALRRRIGYVPQDGGLLPHWRVERNVELVLRLNEDPRAAERGRDALALVGLEPNEFGRRWPRELSGGQRQRVAIARALVNKPSILLADEPTGNLDTRTGAEILELFEDLSRKGNTLIVVTHEEEVARHARRIIRIRDGEVAGDAAVE